MAFFFFFLLAFLIADPAAVCAKTMFITDRVEIQVRSSTGLEYRVLGRVKTGKKVEVLETTKGWAKIRLSDGTVGWINSIFLVDKIRGGTGLEPKGQEEFQELKETLQHLSQEKESLLQEKIRLTQELENLRVRMQNLLQEKSTKVGSEWTALQVKNEQLAKENSACQRELAELKQKKKAGILSDQIVWFLIGSLVLFLGLLLGWGLSRGQRRTRRYY